MNSGVFSFKISSDKTDKISELIKLINLSGEVRVEDGVEYHPFDNIHIRAEWKGCGVKREFFISLEMRGFDLTNYLVIATGALDPKINFDIIDDGYVETDSEGFNKILKFLTSDKQKVDEKDSQYPTKGDFSFTINHQMYQRFAQNRKFLEEQGFLLTKPMSGSAKFKLSEDGKTIKAKWKTRGDKSNNLPPAKYVFKITAELLQTNEIDDGYLQYHLDIKYKVKEGKPRHKVVISTIINELVRSLVN